MSSNKNKSMGRSLMGLMEDKPELGGLLTRTDGTTPEVESSAVQTQQPANQIGESKYFECFIEDIIPNPNQPRKLFPKEELAELAASIEEKGIIQPIVVRPIGGGKFEIIAGERRYRAAKLAGLDKVPVVSTNTDDRETLELALIENIQRQDLNPIEEALAYKDLLSRHQYTQDELAKQLGKDRSSIANSLRLLKLPDKVRDHVINNKLSMGHARALLAIENKELQIQMANDIIENNLSVREVELLTKKLKEQIGAGSSSEGAKGALKQSKSEKDFSAYVEQLESHLRRKVLIRSKGQAHELVIAFKSDEELNDLIDRLIL